MSKLVELKKDEYENFVKNNKFKSHFLQSHLWGEFSKAKKNLYPYYLGLIDDDKIVGTVLLLKKKLPLGLCYFYCPRGFVIDFTNHTLVIDMTEKIKEFCKKHKAIFFKIDPDLIKERHNYLNEKLDEEYDWKDIFNNLKSLGYKHLGFTKNFETMQPRYSFRIDLDQDLDTIIDHFSKTTKQRINKANKLNVKVEIGDKEDIKTFHHLMTLTEDRKDFVSFPRDYYEKQYELFSKNNNAVLFLGKINTKEIIKNYQKELEDIEKQLDLIDRDNLSKNAKNKLRELTNKKEKLKKEIEKFKKAKKEYGETITLNAHMIIVYGDKAWVLYAGNHNILTETYANYATYFEHIKYCKEHGIKIYDQFGTIGDFNKDNPRLGLHEFKKKFGGDYVEFIGEFDYILKPFMYFVFNKLVPFYRNIVKNKSKKELKNEVKGNK